MSPDNSVDAAVLAVLQALRIKGYAEVPAIVAFTGLGEEYVSERLEDARARGDVRRREGRIHGWGLTDEGKKNHALLAAGALGDESARSVMAAADAQFLTLNAPMKDLCTRWQMQNQPPECVAQLAIIHQQVLPLVAGLSAVVPRFSTYAERFAAALQRLQSGDSTAFTRPLSDSYHDVWMELHQDLLLSLGRVRGTADGH